MPLVLPTGVVVTPIDPQLDTALAARVVGFRFDVLDYDDGYTGVLESVEPGGSVEISAYAAVKGGGSITVRDRGVAYDWPNIRIRPVALISQVGVPELDTEISLGVYLPAAPVEDWTAAGRSWKVELLDKNSVLDTDIITDGSGDPITYSVPAGTNVLDTVAQIIEDAGESAAAIATGTKTLIAPMSWEVGTTRLTVINDLLEAANYFSLWPDGNGQYLTAPYEEPKDRPPVYALQAPFQAGETSLMDPDWSRDKDIYAIPNRYVCIGSGTGDTEALVGVATNIDPGSPFSYPSRGDRWITRTETNVESTGQDDIDARARRGLIQASSVTAGLSVKHAYLPELQVNRTVRFVIPEAGVDALAYVTKTTIPFDPVALSSSEMREAVTW